MAQEWAEGCDFVHGQPEAENPPFNSLGQNLYFNTALMDVNHSITRWHDENVFYNYDTGDCKSGEQCGHYTLVIIIIMILM